MTIKKYTTSVITLTILISFSYSSPKARGGCETQSKDTTYSATTKQLKSDHIPDSVFAMTSLKHLGITGMDCDHSERKSCWVITEIPPQIRNLKNLTTLSLNLNGIQSIPIELAELKNLKELDLTDNVALSAVDNVEKISSLESLSLYGCSLERLPERIGDLKKLRYLGLIGNQIDKQEQQRIKEALPDCVVRF